MPQITTPLKDKSSTTPPPPSLIFGVIFSWATRCGLSACPFVYPSAFSHEGVGAIPRGSRPEGRCAGDGSTPQHHPPPLGLPPRCLTQYIASHPDDRFAARLRGRSRLPFLCLTQPSV